MYSSGCKLGYCQRRDSRQGYECCKKTAAKAAELLGISEDAVLVASTGVIGSQMPLDRILSGVEQLAEAKRDTIEAGTLAAEAIMTTDTISKQSGGSD